MLFVFHDDSIGFAGLRRLSKLAFPLASFAKGLSVNLRFRDQINAGSLDCAYFAL
jgi:hypothetical protein